MERSLILIIATFIVASLVDAAQETVLSAVLTPKDEKLSRTSRSYYDTPPPRYGTGRPYDRLAYAPVDYDRPSRCGRCQDDRGDRDEDYADNRRRDRYDDERRLNHRPTYGNNNRFDRNKGNDEEDRRYNTDRPNAKKNGTEEENDKDKNQYDDKDRRPTAGRRDRDRNRHDDRDKYRPDYYDRFLGDKYERDRYDRDRYDRNRYERPYYDDYRERRPLYDRYDDGYAGRYEGYGGRYDGYGYGAYRRPASYGDRYDNVGAYDDSYGGYGPSVGRGPHDSFRPWDETYRGQAGWDAGGRGYYFASGRPDSTAAQGWNRPEYVRPQYSESGWQNVGYAGYRDPQGYRAGQGAAGYGAAGYGTGYGTAGYSAGYGTAGYGAGYQDVGQASGWRDVGERRPYRDQSGIPQLESGYSQPTRAQGYGQSSQDYDQRSQHYGQAGQDYAKRGQQYQPGQAQAQSSRQTYTYSSTTTPNTNYLFEREDGRVTAKATEDSTNTTNT